MGKKAPEDSRDVFEKALDGPDLAEAVIRVGIGAIQGRVAGKLARRLHGQKKPSAVEANKSKADRGARDDARRWDNASTAIGASLGGLGAINNMDQKIQERRK